MNNENARWRRSILLPGTWYFQAPANTGSEGRVLAAIYARRGRYEYVKNPTDHRQREVIMLPQMESDEEAQRYVEVLLRLGEFK